MKKARIKVTQETDSGRNTRFHDNYTGREMTIGEFVRAIESGKYPDYHIRIINGIKTPVSDPDKSEKNNLG